MRRATFDIDRKVLAGLIAGAAAFALTKLAIPLDPQLEQLVNVAAAVVAAYLVPSKTPAALTNELVEGDDIAEAPTRTETAALRTELTLPEPDARLDEPQGATDPDVDDELGDVPDLPSSDEARMWGAAEADFAPFNGNGATATIAPPAPVEAEVDETEFYGEVNQTGLTDADVTGELGTGPLEDRDDDGPPPALRY
jgi:hypothetical protein